MKRFKFLALTLAAVFIFWAVAFALQPQPGDSTGIITGTPTNLGSILLTIVQLAAGALVTFLLTKVATKFPIISGWVTVFAGTAIGGVIALVGNFLFVKIGLATGLAVIPGALLNYILASAWYEYLQNRPKPPVPA